VLVSVVGVSAAAVFSLQRYMTGHGPARFRPYVPPVAWVTMSGAEGGGIFVSYRRQESAHLAGRLYDRLADRFGEGQVFIDVDAIEPGVDFAEAISRAVAACQVLLAVIGPAWLTTTDERGRRRLDDPDDIVRVEIGAALARGVRVIPILVEGAAMPGRDDLPESLAGLARRNALVIRHESFRSDAGRLLATIERVLPAVPGSETDQSITSDEAPPFATGVFGSSTVSANEIIDKFNQGALTKTIPTRYASFIARVDNILRQNNAQANKLYDGEADVLFLDASIFVVYVSQLEEIAEVAEGSSVKYIIKIDNPPSA
jgi:TIR domain